MRGPEFTSGHQPGELDRAELEAPAAGVVRAAEAQPEVGPEEGAAPAEEAAQAAEADPAGADAPVGADEPIGTCTGLVYSELSV